MTLPIAQLGQPILRQKIADIPTDDIATDTLQKFIDDLLATVKEHQGIGLAAPQVFSHRRIFVAGVLPPPSEDALPSMEVFVNPTITPLGETQKLGWEGCLSFSELLVLVPRFDAIRVDFLNRDGQPQQMELEGFAARVVQHEYDHLDGLLTLDRAPSTRWIIKASEVEAANKELEALAQTEEQ